jgi:UDP-N-acetylmuramoyl-L-alanyl-D-glutamate--2,6-diaminopimelate ligase
MIKAILEKDNKRVAIFGTLGVEIAGVSYASDLTTTDPIELHRFFHTAYLAGVEYVVMEVSAHAIHYKKLHGVMVDIAVFTNLTQDHLDFFGNIQSYSLTKVSYFSPEFIRYAVVNVDDEVGREILQDSKVPMATFGIFNPADTFAIDYDCKMGIKSIVNTFDDIFELSTPFTGEFNLYNALGAITVCRLLGISILTIREAFFRMPEVEGRFNIMNGKRMVVVDFAHTPDGLKNLLQSARGLTCGKVISVFGCGGDRDSKKRAIMGEISAKYADFTVITSDNPRSENPMDIIREIEVGHKKVNRNYITIPDRKMAVEYAIISATCNDVVVLAGKGAENYVEEKGIKRPYSDKNEVLEVFRRYNL